MEILKNLAKIGYKTSLIALRSQNTVKNENPQVCITSIPLRYVPLFSPVIFAFMLFFFMPFYIILSKPDIIITEPDVSIFGFISVIPFSKFKKVQLIMDIRSTPVEVIGFRGWLRTLCFNLSVLIAKKFFDGMTIITPFMKDEICGKFKINPKFVGVWSSGVADELFNPPRYISEGEELKKKFGLSKKFIVFYHGTFSANRGLTETMEAMCIIKRVYPDVLLFLLGSGSFTDNLRELLRTKELQGNVVLHTSVEYVDVPKYIAMSDVCIIPLPNCSYWRFQCPLKLLEYLAMEKVVILTDIPAHRAVISKAKCGIYISSNEPIKIAKAIEFAYRNKGNLAVWGKDGRKIIQKKFTWEIVAQNLENYLLNKLYE